MERLRRSSRSAKVLAAAIFLLAGCFRSLLLVTCPYLLLTKAFVHDLKPIRIGDAYSAVTYCDLTFYTNPTNSRWRKHPRAGRA
jgi:hypothetical protein